MSETPLDTMLDTLRGELARTRARAIAINLVAADLLQRGYYVYRQEMSDELHHLLAIRDDDTTIYRVRALTHAPVHGLDDLLPGELMAIVTNGEISYHPQLPE